MSATQQQQPQPKTNGFLWKNMSHRQKRGHVKHHGTRHESAHMLDNQKHAGILSITVWAFCWPSRISLRDNFTRKVPSVHIQSDSSVLHRGNM